MATFSLDGGDDACQGHVHCRCEEDWCYQEKEHLEDKGAKVAWASVTPCSAIVASSFHCSWSAGSRTEQARNTH